MLSAPARSDCLHRHKVSRTYGIFLSSIHTHGNFSLGDSLLHILRTILKTPSAKQRKKAFSTCPYDCGFHFSGCTVIVLLASTVHPQENEAVKEAYTGFMVGGTGSQLLVGGAGSCPSGGQGCVLWAAMCSGRL